MILMLDPERLRLFMRTFFGYGAWTAPLWFVGMEEGGGANIEEIARRLDAWDGSELEDLRRFHRLLGGVRWFDDHPPLQRTWTKLATVVLRAQSQPADRESRRRHQRDELGSRDGLSALIELLPLPSPSTGHWIYADTGLPELSSRKVYRREFAMTRVDAIRRRIDEHKPHAVILYGDVYRKYWQMIAGSPFEMGDDRGIEFCRRGHSLLLLATHPTAQGVKNEYFCRIGEFLRDVLAAS